MGGHVTAVRVAPGKGPPPCPRPRDPPVGVEEDVDEHGGDGGQRVGGHGQDAEAGLGALHGVQRGGGSWQRGESHPSGVGTAWGQYRSATPWPSQPRPTIFRGAEGWPWGVPRGCGYRRWELEHLGGKRVVPGDPVSLTRLGLEEAVAHIVAGDRDALAAFFFVDVKFPRQRVDHHRQVPLPNLARGAGSGTVPPTLPVAHPPAAGLGIAGSPRSSATGANIPVGPGTGVPVIPRHSPG